MIENYLGKFYCTFNYFYLLLRSTNSYFYIVYEFHSRLFGQFSPNFHYSTRVSPVDTAEYDLPNNSCVPMKRGMSMEILCMQKNHISIIQKALYLLSNEYFYITFFTSYIALQLCYKQFKIGPSWEQIAWLLYPHVGKK